MEGDIGPVASASHHGMVMRMPGMPVCAPMTPGEWLGAWEWFMAHDDPLYVSEHRRSFPIDYEMSPILSPQADITILAISAARLNAREAVKLLHEDGITCDLIDLTWLKPLQVPEVAIESLKKTRLGVVIDSDFEISGPSRSIAYELMLKLSVPVHALGLEDKTAGFAPHLDNGTPTVERMYDHLKTLVKKEDARMAMP
jgi:pyruvate/2-oxoglutarate/acetoin dehydrogenase E1 component